MIISCEHEIQGNESVLRIWPSLDPRDGRKLAEQVAEMSDHEQVVLDLENERDEANSLASKWEDQVSDLQEAIRHALEKIRDINPKALKPEMIVDAKAAIKILEDAL